MSHSLQKFVFAMSLSAICLLVPGCEVGRSWFSMSSDSPSPWFGFDLMPRRRTTSLNPQPRPPHLNESFNRTSKAELQPVSHRPRPSGSHSRELHLPSIPAYFDGNTTEELSFTGPEGAFSR